jgi:HAD superfamily hydrolase (TIGR01549 family)
MKALLFDLDSSLVYTSPEYTRDVVNRTFAHFGCAMPTEWEAHSVWNGNSSDDIIRRLGAEPDAYWTKFTGCDNLSDRISHTRPYPDINVLLQLRNQGHLVGIVTNAPPAVAELEIGLIGRHNFDAVISVNIMTGRRPKPEPDGILECMKLLGVERHETSYHGDSWYDMLCARNAGVKSVHLRRHQYVEMLQAPDHAIDTLHELPALISSLQQRTHDPAQMGQALGSQQ